MVSTVLSVASRAVVDACRALGLDDIKLLSECQIDRDTLNDPDACIPAEKADQLWQTAYILSKDPLLSLHAAESLSFGAFRVLDYLASTSATIGEGLGAVAEYFPLVDPRGVLTIREQSQRMILGFESADKRFELPPPAQEFTLAALLLRSREGTGVDWNPASVHFSYPKPNNTAEYERIFKCPVLFGQATASLIVPQNVWRQKSNGADASLHAVLATHAGILFERRRLPDEGIVQKVTEQILAALRNGIPGMDVIARNLGMSSKTLQRRLKDSGVTFANLADDIRHEQAKRYLCDKAVALVEVSWLLGFSEQSAFNRAFKRWTGQSPAKWRSTVPDN